MLVDLVRKVLYKSGLSIIIICNKSSLNFLFQIICNADKQSGVAQCMTTQFFELLQFTKEYHKVIHFSISFMVFRRAVTVVLFSGEFAGILLVFLGLDLKMSNLTSHSDFQCKLT